MHPCTIQSLIFHSTANNNATIRTTQLPPALPLQHRWLGVLTGHPQAMVIRLCLQSTNWNSRRDFLSTESRTLMPDQHVHSPWFVDHVGLWLRTRDHGQQEGKYLSRWDEWYVPPPTPPTNPEQSSDPVSLSLTIRPIFTSYHGQAGRCPLPAGVSQTHQVQEPNVRKPLHASTLLLPLTTANGSPGNNASASSSTSMSLPPFRLARID